MRRTTLSALPVAVALLLSFGAAPVTAQETAETQISLSMKLRASNGLSARIENDGNQVSLLIRGPHREVEYDVHGSVTEDGIEARFGGLGRIAAAFQPTRTIEANEPPPGCRGEPRTEDAGVFSGVLEFTGPHRFVTINQAEAHGTMRVMPEWTCKGAAHRPLGVRRGAKPSGAPERDEATLTAADRAHGRFFEAVAVRDPHGRDYTAFFGGTLRRQGTMRVASVAFVVTHSVSFEFDHQQGTADISAARAPFSGAARFRRGPSGSRWSGSLRVDLLDSPRPVALTGSAFKAKLVRDFPGD